MSETPTPDSEPTFSQEQDKQKRGTTRRTFLKSAGLVSASVAGAEMLSGMPGAEAEAQANAVGPGKVPLKLRINGEVHVVNV